MIAIATWMRRDMSRCSGLSSLPATSTGSSSIPHFGQSARVDLSDLRMHRADAERSSPSSGDDGGGVIPLDLHTAYGAAHA